jgi:hypothetical protein
MMFEYVENLTALKDLLIEHNTSTASPDLSADLDLRVRHDDVHIGDPSLTHIRNDRYPALFVRIADAQEEFQSLGTTGARGVKKAKTVVYDVFAFYRRDGAAAEYGELLQDAYRLARNVEGVIQADPTLGGTAMWANPKNTQFANIPFDGGTWVKSVLIEIEARYLFQ